MPLCNCDPKWYIDTYNAIKFHVPSEDRRVATYYLSSWYQACGMKAKAVHRYPVGLLSLYDNMLV